MIFKHHAMCTNRTGVPAKNILSMEQASLAGSVSGTETCKNHLGCRQVVNYQPKHSAASQQNGSKIPVDSMSGTVDLSSSGAPSALSCHEEGQGIVKCTPGIWTEKIPAKTCSLIGIPLPSNCLFVITKSGILLCKACALKVMLKQKATIHLILATSSATSGFLVCTYYYHYPAADIFDLWLLISLK